MTDRFDVPLETSAGQRGPGSFGERLAVALAVIALLGGAFILGGKVLHRDDAVAVASPTPGVPTSASLAPTPAATSRVFTVNAEPLPGAPPQQASGFSGWIRALEDLPMRSRPSAGADQVGALPRGAAAAVHEVPSSQTDGTTWLQLDEWSPASSGQGGELVAANRGSKALVRRYAWPIVPSSAWVNGLVASPDQFLAWGYRRSDAGGAQRPFMIISSDGQRWEPVALTVFGGRLPDRVAYGSAGWLALATVGPTSSFFDPGPDRIWLWRSPDGIHWDSLGNLNGTAGYYPSQLVANGDGYELVLDTGRRTSELAWHSSDGLTWTESTGFTGGVAWLAASPTGFYAWSGAATSGGPLGLHSADGLSWGPVTDGPSGTVRGIVGLRDGLLATDASPVTGAPRIWMRARAGDDSSWVRTKDLPDSSGTAIASLAGDGQRVVALGWDRATIQPVAWIGDGTTWERAQVPAATFGGTIPTQVAMDAAGIVAIGSAPTLQAENPVIWRSKSGSAWAAVDVPELEKVGDATATHCPARPSDVLELLVLPPPGAIACFGRASMTFRAWLTPCQGCAGVGPGRFSDGWLQGPDTVAISPIQGQQDFQARLAPGLATDARWGSQPVEVTGHFDDPAATGCRYVPDVTSGGSPISRADLVNACRQAFVITRVRFVSAGG